MSVKIRLTRGGSKKRPFYAIIAIDSKSPRDGKYIEKLGTYDPMVAKESESRLKINVERAKYWLGVGAQPTDRVKKFLAKFDLIAKPEIPVQTKAHLQSKQTLEKIKAKEAAKAKA